jgi:hypothetical protein
MWILHFGYKIWLILLWQTTESAEDDDYDDKNNVHSVIIELYSVFIYVFTVQAKSQL